MKFVFTIGVVWLAFLLILFTHNVQADEKILVATATALNFALNEICPAFEEHITK